MTSIEWLMERYLSQNHSLNIFDFMKAKEMHKQEIIKSFEYGVTEGVLTDINYLKCNEEAEQYYQETFVSKGSDDHISDVSKMVEDDVEKLAEINATWDDIDVYSYKLGFKEGYNKAKEDFEIVLSARELHNYKLGVIDGQKEAKENTFTEEQVREAIFEALALVYHQSTIGVRIEDVNEIIQSLKQPKQ